MNPISVLLVEDDPNLGLLLQEYLNDKGYQTTLAIDGQAGWQAFVDKEYDFCIFDVMMPKKDGFSLAKEVRMSGRDVPILFLTAKAMKEDTIQGFKLGADDYITKPFDREELVLRMEAILRRYKLTSSSPVAATTTRFEIGSFMFDYSKQQLEVNGQSTRLTSKESGLLKLFCENINQPISRSFALKMIWGDDSYFNARSMDVYVTKLRKHLREDASIQIMNLHGEGFKLLVNQD